MPRPPELFFSDWTELQRLLCSPCLKGPNGKPRRAKGRPYDPEDLELCALWNADRESGMKWSHIAKKRLPGAIAAEERIKQGVRRYRAFCAKQGIEPGALLEPGAPLIWKDEWEKALSHATTTR